MMKLKKRRIKCKKPDQEYLPDSDQRNVGGRKIICLIFSLVTTVGIKKLLNQ